MTSTGYNLDTGNTCGFSNADNITNSDPLLGSATENGGLTLTLALSPNSPAIDYIPAEACTVATDQRGEEYPRPVDGNKDGIAKCDIGSFELPPPTSDHITVTSSANSGPGSLRWALAEITDGGMIDFALPDPTKIVLTSELVVDKVVNVNGPGVHELKISGNKMTRLFKVMDWATLNIHSLTLTDGKVHQPLNVSGLVEPGGSIFNLGTVNIQNALITNNEADQGGAIHNSGILTISGSLITNNAAGTSSEFGDGGGIYNDGKLTIRNTSLLDNRAHGGGGIINWGKGEVKFITSAITGNSAGNGGGIENGDEGVVIIENNSTIENNSATFIGGGIVNYDAGVIEIRDTLLSKNSVLQDGGGIYVGGGGIYNFGNGTVDIANSILSDNLANSGYGAGIRNQGTMSVLYTTFNGNKVISKERGDGGGVYNEGNITITGSSFFSNEAVGGGGLINYGQTESKFGRADIRKSTFAYNIAYNGGAVENAGFGEVVISNSTFSQNKGIGGGGIATFNQAYTKIANSTIAFNNASNGGGIYNVGNIPVEIDQSILAKNQPQNCTGPTLSSGDNLDSDDTCAFPIGDNLINIDPLLGPLQDNSGPTLTHALLPDSPAINTVSLGACPPPETDQRGFGRPQGFSCDIGAYEVLNNSPIARADGPYTADEGSMVTLNASASTDPDGDPLTYEWDLDNDGVYDDAVGMIVKVTFPDDGQYPVALRVSDPMGSQSTDTTVVDVLNVPPAIGEFSTSKMPALVRTTVSVSASFSDPGPLDTHTASLDWGDGNSSTGLVDGYSVTGSHAYSMPGIYTLTLTLTDDDGGSDSLAYQYIIVYSPDAGFITGGKWVDLPTGSYIPDPTLTGKATFNFNVKYQKGAVSPEGKADFQFKAADLDFKSTSYDWLVIAGTKAQFQGSGMINGAGDYGFMITAMDGSPDTIRIKVWDNATGEVIYDTMPDAMDTVDPTTVVQKGSIVIHNRK